MRVLFAPDSKNISEQSGIRIEKMIKALHQPGNRIGILTEAPDLNKRFKDLIYLNDISEINEADWDIVLVQNNLNLQCIGRKVRRKPIIFISNSSRKRDQFINLPNLYQVITTQKDIDCSIRSIPSEFIESIRIPVYKPHKITEQVSEQNEYFKLVYFVNENDENLKVSRSVIKAVNYISYVFLTVVSLSENISLLQEIANDNITFRPYKGSTHGKYFCGHDVVLASEELAVTAVLSKRPVIVVGVNGLGGLVCSDNLPGFMRTGFKGRIGGTYYEDIPAGLLDYEIRYALGIEEEKKTPFIDEEGYSSLKKYHADNWKKKFCS